MHSCGNIFHDFPQWLMMAIPFLAPAIVWARYKWNWIKLQWAKLTSRKS